MNRSGKEGRGRCPAYAIDLCFFANTVRVGTVSELVCEGWDVECFNSIRESFCKLCRQRRRHANAAGLCLRPYFFIDRLAGVSTALGCDATRECAGRAQWRRRLGVSFSSATHYALPAHSRPGREASSPLFSPLQLLPFIRLPYRRRDMRP